MTPTDSTFIDLYADLMHRIILCRDSMQQYANNYKKAGNKTLYSYHQEFVNSLNEIINNHASYAKSDRNAVDGLTKIYLHLLERNIQVMNELT